jgi:hypothetical protein
MVLFFIIQSKTGYKHLNPIKNGLFAFKLQLKRQKLANQKN